MKLTILGSGNYQPELIRHSSSYLVKIGKQNLIFDFGRGILDQLLKVGVEYYHIDVIFITHAHADHCSELGSFLHIALAEPEAGKFRKKDVTIYGPKGIKRAISHLLRAFDLEKFRPLYKIKIRELTNNSLVRGQNWLVKSYQARHNINSLSYRLESKGKILAYSGDTEDCSGLRKCCQNADLAILEASWPKELQPKEPQPKYHMNAKDAGRMANESGVKKMILTHVAPYYLKNFDIKKEAKKFYKGPILIAKDLMKIKI